MGRRPSSPRFRFAGAFALAIAALTLASPLSAAAPDAGPRAAAEGPAVQQAERFVQALTAGDDSVWLRFMHQNDPTSEMTDDQWKGARRQLGQLQLHAVTNATATHAELSAFDPNTESWMTISVTVEPNPPYRLADWSIVFAAHPPADAPSPPKLAPTALVEATKAKLADEVARGRFDGAVLVARGGRVLLSTAYGLADRDDHKANTTDTQFRFGSMGKMFTAVAIMQLAEDGKLDLTAPIGHYLKDYPNAEIATKVTIDQLLTHTGGTGDIFGPDFEANKQTLHDAKDYVALYGARPPLFPPGSRFDYSNYGFILLGRIVEVVSGEGYDDYVRRHIFAPAGMTSTGMQPENVPLPGRAIGYMSVGDKLESDANTLPYRGTPAGGGYSTTGDMLRFADALMANHLLNADLTKRLTSGGATIPGGGFYPYDLHDKTADARPYIGHGGGAPGMNGQLRIFPDSNYVIVVLANRDPPIAGVIANFISDRLQ